MNRLVVAHHYRHLRIVTFSLIIALICAVVPAEATARTSAARIIDACHVLSPHLAATILKGPVQLGIADQFTRGDNSLYVHCSYWLVAKGFDGPYVQVGIFQQNPAAHGSWPIDAAWRENIANLKVAGFSYETVAGIGDGGVWVKSLHELFVLQRPRDIVLVLYRTNLTKPPTLAAISSVTRTILSHL